MESSGERWSNTGGGGINRDHHDYDHRHGEGQDGEEKEGEEREDGRSMQRRHVGDTCATRQDKVAHSTGIQSTSSQAESVSESPPSSLRCPVTKLEVVDPILCVADGCVYESVAIEELLRLGHPSPVNGQAITR